MIVGNDIASYQGDVNYDVYSQNSNFVIVKATEGNGFIDPKFHRNQNEARRVGLLLGYYHFARPDLNNPPEAEADWFLTTIGELHEGEILCLDYEPASQKQSDVDWCKKWLDHIQDKTGVKALIYLNQSQVKKFDWSTVVGGGYGLWIAAYVADGAGETGKWPFAAMQQWTSSQSVPGISGNVDGDHFFGDAPTFKKYGFKPTPPPDPCAEVKKENTDLKNQVSSLQDDKKTLSDQLAKALADLKTAQDKITQLENQTPPQPPTVDQDVILEALKPYIYSGFFTFIFSQARMKEILEAKAV